MSADFDKFADDYRSQLEQIIPGEDVGYFAEYKVQALVSIVGENHLHGSRILDFGAGVGTSVPSFRKFIPSCHLTCVDVSPKSLEYGEETYGDLARFVHFDGKHLPFSDASFDVVFAACVFHHIDAREHDEVLREMRRVLSPGGMIIAFEHNPLNPVTRRIVNRCVFDEGAVLIRAFRLKRAFEQVGLVDIERNYRLFFPNFLRVLRPLEGHLGWLPLGGQYCVHGTKPLR